MPNMLQSLKHWHLELFNMVARWDFYLFASSTKINWIYSLWRIHAWHVSFFDYDALNAVANVVFWGHHLLGTQMCLQHKSMYYSVYSYRGG